VNHRLYSNFDEMAPTGGLRHDAPYRGQCAHAWAPPERLLCSACGAKCVRDGRGALVMYTTGGGRPGRFD
jgi:hypothetical protein